MFDLSNFILLPEHKLNACLKQNILDGIAGVIPELFLRQE